MTIRILLADDHQIVRQGLKSLIEQQPDMELVGEASDGLEAVRLAAELRPRLVIMDLSMPGLNGAEAIRRILEDNPLVRVLVLSMHSDRRFVASALGAGASAYLLKDCAFEDLTQAIRAVMGGQTYLTPRIAGVVVDEYRQRLRERPASQMDLLTPREREVLQLLAEGHGTKAIAAKLDVSVKTVETHRENIMRKLDLHSIAELTKFAVKEGLTSLEP